MDENMSGLLSGATREDIPLDAAYNAHQHTSHVPEQRAEQERSGYMAHMQVRRPVPAGERVHAGKDRARGRARIRGEGLGKDAPENP